MTIVIDISEKWNSELAAGHVRRDWLSSDHYLDLCKLYITDDYAKAISLRNQGLFVVPIYNESNTDFDYSSFKHLIANPDEVDIDYYYKIWQRFVNLPWHILETSRCIVREMTPADLPALYEIYSDPLITKYTEPLFPDYEDELEYTHNYINNVYSYFGFGTWIIERKTDHKIIGRAGFNYRPGYDDPELGYVIGLPYQNMGYAKEVCSAIMLFLHEEFEINSIIAFSHRDNLPSVKLLNSLRFEVLSENVAISSNNIVCDSSNMASDNGMHDDDKLFLNTSKSDDGEPVSDSSIFMDEYIYNFL